MRYTIIFEKGEKGYGAYVPDLPGCVAAGESRQEVEQLIREAISFHLDGMKEEGLPIPPPVSEPGFMDIEAI